VADLDLFRGVVLALRRFLRKAAHETALSNDTVYPPYDLTAKSNILPVHFIWDANLGCFIPKPFSGHWLYDSWIGQLRRTTDLFHTNYSNYGGRGRTMYPAWVGSFGQPDSSGIFSWQPDALAFLSYVLYIETVLGRRSHPADTLDRIENKRGYFPGNLLWATKLTQARNRGPMRFNGFAAGLVWHAIAQGQFRRLFKYLSRARL
jgi:hypothetical protein